MKASSDLATLLSTRLCHDLTGPISAINNGAELLEEGMLDSPDEAVALMLESAKEAAARIQFYRLAFGHLTSGEEDTLLSRKQIIDAFFEKTKVKIDWPDMMPVVTQELIRIIFNLLIVASQSLIKGGIVTLEPHPDHSLSLIAKGEMVRVNPTHLEVLNGHLAVEPVDPKMVQLCLLRMLMQENGNTLEATVYSDKQLSLTLHPAKTDAH